MPAGIHTYPFHFALPADLPSTFESSIAKVAYYIKIKSKPTYKLRKAVPFTVLGNVNLNHVDEILVRTYLFKSKRCSYKDYLSLLKVTHHGLRPYLESVQTIPRLEHQRQDGFGIDACKWTYNSYGFRLLLISIFKF